MNNKVSIPEWNRFVKEAISYDDETNLIFPFKKLTQKYGKAYVEYLKAAYEAKCDLSDEEFCRLNHCPPSFIKKICETN